VGRAGATADYTSLDVMSGRLGGRRQHGAAAAPQPSRPGTAHECGGVLGGRPVVMDLVCISARRAARPADRLCQVDGVLPPTTSVTLGRT
jgi:hypothetical protein